MGCTEHTTFTLPTEPQICGTYTKCVDVHLDKLELVIVALEPFKHGADHATGATPGGPKVDDNDLARVDLYISTVGWVDPSGGGRG